MTGSTISIFPSAAMRYRKQRRKDNACYFPNQKKLKPLYLIGKGKSFFHLPWISLDSLWLHRALSHTALHSPTEAEEKTCNARRALRFGQISYRMKEKAKTICPVHEAMDQSRQRADVTAQEAPPVLTSYLSLAQSSQCSLLGNSLLRCRNLFLMANWGETELCLMGIQIFKTINSFVINDDAPDLCLEDAQGDLTSVNCSNHLGECWF